MLLLSPLDMLCVKTRSGLDNNLSYWGFMVRFSLEIAASVNLVTAPTPAPRLPGLSGRWHACSRGNVPKPTQEKNSNPWQSIQAARWFSECVNHCFPKLRLVSAIDRSISSSLLETNFEQLAFPPYKYIFMPRKNTVNRYNSNHGLFPYIRLVL